MPKKVVRFLFWSKKGGSTLQKVKVLLKNCQGVVVHI